MGEKSAFAKGFILSKPVSLEKYIFNQCEKFLFFFAVGDFLIQVSKGVTNPSVFAAFTMEKFLTCTPVCFPIPVKTTVAVLPSRTGSQSSYIFQNTGVCNTILKIFSITYEKSYARPIDELSNIFFLPSQIPLDVAYHKTAVCLDLRLLNA